MANSSRRLREVRATQPQSSLTAPLRCARCGDVIGVYEPLVLVSGHAIRVTSRAAEPGVGVSDGVGYHASCHESSSLHGSDPL
jgi:hypothetical protein